MRDLPIHVGGLGIPRFLMLPHCIFAQHLSLVAHICRHSLMQRTSLIQNSETYCNPWESIFEANPQRSLERGESVILPPMFVLQGELDDNVLPAVQEHFVATYRAAGGEIDFEIYPGAEHRWVMYPGPQTDRAIEMIKAFIARQLHARQPVG